MEDELKNLIKVWSLAIISFCYCFYVSAKLPKGLFRLISLFPIFYLFVLLPLNLSSLHACGPTAFFLAWLANFKLLLFCFDQGPLSPPPPNVFHFISMASLPIKTKQNPKPLNIQNHENMQRNGTPIQNKAIKVLLLAVLFHSYNYKQYLQKNVILAMYCLHTYLELEIILALTALPVRALFGFEIEPQFDEPYLATSLQNFWGHRWNFMVPSILRPTVYHPIRRICTSIIGSKWASLPAVIAVFVVSGLMHELIYYYFTRMHPTWEVTSFFILHGVALVTEIVVKKIVSDKLRLHRAISGPLTLGFVAATGVWLFFPQLLRSRIDEKAIGEYHRLMDFVKDVLSL